MARSKSLDGPYELHPNWHLLTSKDSPDAPLPRAGHGQIVETPDGQVYHTHLCSRPIPGTKRSPMGRETAMQKCEWRADGWLYLVGGGMVPAVEVAPPKPAARIEKAKLTRYAFDGALPLDFQWLRTPHPERIFSLKDRPGHLRLYGRESVGSWFEQALVARRQEDFCYRAETELAFAPATIQQVAGLTAYYNRHKFHMLAITWHEVHGRSLTILSCEGDWPDTRLSFPLPQGVKLGDGDVKLAVTVAFEKLQFAYSEAGVGWRDIGPVLDASLLSDEAGRGEHASFTGAFVGMIAFDTSGAAAPADFGYFTYERRI